MDSDTGEVYLHNSTSLPTRQLTVTRRLWTRVGSTSVRPSSAMSSGVHVMKTVQAVILAVYEEPVVPEQCANTTEKLGEYLISVGY